jgi:cobalt-zinc-cadmium efflux system protein
MSKRYKVVGLHCEQCSSKLAEILDNKSDIEGLNYNSESNVLTINNLNDYEMVKLIVQSNGGALINESEIKKSTIEKHNHDHHHHHHGESTSIRNIGIAFFLNFLFSIGEFIFGTLFNSVAIMSDAVHDLGDSISIGIAWVLQKLSKKEPDSKYKDGYGRFSVLGALFTGIVLIMGSIFMIIRSVPRLINPVEVDYEGMLILAIIAIIINVFAAWLMHKGSSKNEKMLSLHMLEDVLGWFAVLIVSIILRYTDFYILDPVLAIMIAAFILYKAISPFIDSLKIFMNKVPEHLDLQSLEEKILKLEKVNKVTNIHTHSIDGDRNIFVGTLFVSTDNLSEIESIKDNVRVLLMDYDITNSTIEVVIDLKKIV